MYFSKYLEIIREIIKPNIPMIIACTKLIDPKIKIAIYNIIPPI